jgi:hypothetical protein
VRFRSGALRQLQRVNDGVRVVALFNGASKVSASGGGGGQ